MAVQPCMGWIPLKKKKWWEKYLSKLSLIKHTCSPRDKLIVLWILNSWAKIFLRTAYWIMKISWKDHTESWGKNFFKKPYKVKRGRSMFIKCKTFHKSIQSPSHLLTLELPSQFVSWASTKTKIPNCIIFAFLFCGANHSGDSHGSTSPTNNISFQLGQTWSCLNYVLNISYWAFLLSLVY